MKRRRNPYAELERDSQLRKPPSWKKVLEQLADAEVVTEPRFRARQQAPTVDAETMGKILGDVSPAAFRLSFELVELWRWADADRPNHYPDRFEFQWDLAQFLARHDRDRKLEMYRILPRDSEDRVVWRTLKPLAKFRYHAPLQDGVKMPGIWIWTPSTRLDTKRLRDRLSAYSEIVERYQNVNDALFRAADEDQRDPIEPAAESFFRDYFEEFRQIVRDLTMAGLRTARARELLDELYERVDESDVGITSDALVTKPEQHLPMFTEIAVDLVFAITKQLRPRPRGVRQKQDAWADLAGPDEHAYRRRGLFNDKHLVWSRDIVRLTYGVEITQKELHSKVLEQVRAGS